MVNLLVEITFDGRDYFGTQIQKNLLTIQGVITDLLSNIYNEKIKIHPCSRLDQGVSASSYYFNYLTENDSFNLEKLRYVLNRLLPLSIRIVNITKVPEEFDARRDAKMKVYSYLIHLGNYDPLHDQFAFVPTFKVDIDILKECLAMFKGEHDFSCFYSSDDKLEKPFKIIEDIKINEENPGYYNILIKGKSFGRYQIRYIIGACYQVSIGKLKKEDILAKLQSIDKTHVTFKAPSNALRLEIVEF